MNFKAYLYKILFIVITLYSIVLVHADSSVLNNNASIDVDNFKKYYISRPNPNNQKIAFYLSKPQNKNNYPIVILIGGSTDKDDISSIANFHQYFMKDFVKISAGAVTVEPWGVDGNEISKTTFFDHYTRTQILQDYQTVINYLKISPPSGWNGKLGLLGVSEGGHIATTLASIPSNNIIATVNWSGASDWSWKNELWAGMQEMYKQNPTCTSSDCKDIKSRSKYDARMKKILADPSPNKWFFNMTNLYMADALKYPRPDYRNINGRFLLVTGTKDTLVGSSDDFYKKAELNNVKVTYWRIESMDHYIRKRPDLIQNSFNWLQQQLVK